MEHLIIRRKYWKRAAVKGMFPAMSSVRLPTGEDHPDAAGKHLDDAQLLFVHDRWDCAAYLAGYVAECCLKAVILVGNAGTKDWPGGGKGHDLTVLEGKALSWLSASAFSGRSAKYQPPIGAATALKAGWKVDARYFPAGHTTETDAATYVKEAEELYKATIIQMRMDGLL